MSASPSVAHPWQRILDQRLPIYPQVPVEDLPPSAIHELCGALFATLVAIHDQPLDPVAASVLSAIARDHAVEAAELKRAMRRGVGPADILRASLAALLPALLNPDPLGFTLDLLLSDLPDVADVASYTSAAWTSASRPLIGMVTFSGYLLPRDRRYPPTSPVVRCWNDWLDWIHGRDRPSSDRAYELAHDAAADDAPTPRPRKPRPHHFALLLEALSCSTAALWWYPILDEQLQKRERRPQHFGELLHDLFLRQSYEAQDREDVRTVPMVKLTSSWGWLGGAGETLSDTLEGLALSAAKLKEPFSLGLIRPPVRYEIAGTALRSLQGEQRAASEERLRWIGDLVLAWSGKQPDPALDGLIFPLRAELRVVAALAYTLHEDADNFAARVMPSVAGWRELWPKLGPWLKGEGAAVLANPADRRRPDRELPFAAWKVTPRAGGDPLTASRLYIELTRALVQDTLPEVLAFTPFQAPPDLGRALESLNALLRAFLSEAADRPWCRATRSREQGLRWPGEPRHEHLDQTRRPGPQAIPPGALRPPCARCSALARALEARAAEEAQGPGSTLAWPQLSERLQAVHDAFHAGRLPGACPSCAALLLPHAAAAEGALSEILWRWSAPSAVEPGQGGDGFQPDLDALVARLVTSVASYHARAHAGAATAEPSAPPRASVRLDARIEEDHLELSGDLGGHLRSARQPLRLTENAWVLRAGLRALRLEADDTAARLVGTALGERMLDGPVGRLLAEARGQARAGATRVELRLQVDPRWADLPWELLRDPDPQGRFLALDEGLALVRVLARPSPPPPPASRPPSGRVLLVTAGLPAGIAEREVHRVRASGPSVRVIVDADQAALRDSLAEGAWAALHLACHGEPGRLMLRDGELRARDLAQWVSGRVSDAAVVNACLGATAGRADLPGQDWTGVAAALLDAGVPHVVAVATPLSHQDALALASVWHERYAEDGDPVGATAAARRALRDQRPRCVSFGLLQHFTATGRRL